MKKLLVVGLVILSLMLLLGSFLSGFVVGGIYYSNKALSSQNQEVEREISKSKLDLLEDVLNQVETSYVEKPKKQKLINGAIDGLLKALDDPYTRHLRKKAFHEFQEQTSGHFGGVGIELGMRDDHLTVVAPIRNTPAERAGVQAGDIITTINDRSTKGMSIQEAVELIRGEPGTKVTLGMQRNGKEQFKVTLVRDEIKVPNVTGKVLDDKRVGYVMIHSFNEETGKDLKAEIDSLKAKGIQGLILDLRNNPGGLLTEAVNVANLFIKSGPIVKVKSRTGQTETYSANATADDKLPLVILVNKGSASASEIVAGAVQDSGRGVIIGERTFGKGSVQQVIQLKDGSALVLTVAKYLTPKGRSLNKRGVNPDIEVKVDKKQLHKLSGKDDPQLNKAIEVIEQKLKAKAAAG